MILQRVVVCLFAAGFLAGCYSYPDYPAQWSAPLETADACGALPGSYENLGWWGDRDDQAANRRPQLRYFLFENAEDLEGLDRVEIDFGPDRTLHVRGFEGATLLTETTYAEKDSSLTCGTESAEIRVYHGVSRGAGNPLVGYEHTAMNLLKADDGSLIIKSSGFAVGLVYLFFPASAGGHHWFRFPPAE